jgi:hypothetical protein
MNDFIKLAYPRWTDAGSATRKTHYNTDSECGEGERLWGWTRRKIAEMLRMDPRYVPPEWILRPDFSLWPPQRHRAVLWLLAQLVLYRGQQKRELTQHDYMDFLRRKNGKYTSRRPGEKGWEITSASSTQPHNEQEEGVHIK